MLLDYMCSGPVVAMVWEGTNVVAGGRKVIDSAAVWSGKPPAPRLCTQTLPGPRPLLERMWRF